MLKNYIAIILILFGFQAYSQTLKTIEGIEKSYQKCLDDGINMKGCAGHYFKQSDSLLNLAYKKLRLKLTEAGKSKLKTEQRAWLKKRDQYFEKEYSALKKEGDLEEGTRDFDMAYYDKQAEFVMRRVKELIKRMAMTNN